MIKDDFLLSHLWSPEAIQRHFTGILVVEGAADHRALINVAGRAVERSKAHDNVGVLKAGEEFESILRARARERYYAERRRTDPRQA